MLILQKAFETIALMNEQLKRMEFNHAFCKKLKFLVDRFSSFFHLRQKIGRENAPSKEKPGLTVHPRLLSPGKAIAMAICPIINFVHFIT